MTASLDGQGLALADEWQECDVNPPPAIAAAKPQSEGER